ncbi:MAG: cytochrome c oxidase assembly protein [Hoeflea sp.]|uniref:SCO family protein n=1 Tax=Hoeflea sp. TaxID=1940281 RepID=UPI000C0FDFE1|nr:SCO family protein [Hoeflea sp.]PHR19057.1 MAG: cytochrome c oxidase assembly protein [Hoeflea sp.]
MKTFRLILWILVAAMALALGWLTYEWQRTETELSAEPYGVPFELVDQTGSPITEAAFRGRPTALFFGFTHCPEICPTTLFELDGWLRQVDPEGDRIGAYFVTVDPERDTPELLNAYISGVSDRITGITGPADKVNAAVKGFNVYAKKVPVDSADPEGEYTMDHTASVFLLDAEGRFKSTIAWGENPENAVTKLENLLK